MKRFRQTDRERRDQEYRVQSAWQPPWQEFVISDRQIEEYLGLEKRKDLSKLAKLTLIKNLAQQPCKIITSIDWPQQGRVKGFTVEESRLWHLMGIQHHFQEDHLSCKHRGKSYRCSFISGRTKAVAADCWKWPGSTQSLWAKTLIWPYYLPSRNSAFVG